MNMDVSVFDIVGPVMVGPSSSHTAGAARIGRITRNLLGEEPAMATIGLHGSFAKTYRGHGTDRAIIGGLLGFKPDDTRIRESFSLADKAGLHYIFREINLRDVHPNTTKIEVTSTRGKMMTVTASSIGGGNIQVKEIDDLEVNFTGRSHTIVIPHRDTPGIVAYVTGILSEYGINIGGMKLYRKNRGGDAIMIIEMDQETDKDIISKLCKCDNVSRVIDLDPV